jgi:hypothetical protein
MIDRQQLLKDLQRELPKLEKDILAYSEQSAERTAHLKQEYAKAKEAGRTAEHFVSWREAQITQAAVAWVLTCVFVRFLEDNGLLAQPVLAGPVARESGPNSAKNHPLKNAKDRIEAYFNEHPTYAEREYLLHLFEQLEQIPVIAELLDHRHNPLWQIPVSADGAKSLIDFFQKIDPETGQIIHDFTDPNWDTRFLGDLYQDLSEAVRKRYALLQTPEFVESFILDYTLEPAIKTFGLEGLRLIDPTCGSGHFLLTTFERIFERWQKREPGTNSRVLAQRALDVVHGVDINPYAIAICRFRLLMAAMKVCDIELVKDAPAFKFNLACGDSLLHGRRFEWQGQGIQQGLLEDELRHVFDSESIEALNKVLGQQYHVVVGNPPYIVVRDKSLNKAYREKYLTCHRKYSLGVPFTERFFDLTLSEKGSQTSGFIGMITANSFMKREFGAKLITDYLVNKNLTHIVDTSGAFIPGHGTPTVIIFARNGSVNVSSRIRVVMGIRAEPSTPESPEQGKVWSSIVNNIESPGIDSEYISVEDKERSIYETHPWSLMGGGALELKSVLEKYTEYRLSHLVDSIGFGAILGEDEAFGVPSNKTRSSQLPAHSKQMIEGELVRDWQIFPEKTFVFPYDENIELLRDGDIKRWLWPLRTLLWGRSTFSKESYKNAGKEFYEYHQIPKERNKIGHVITFPEVASHNHFVVCDTNYIFSQTAPIIKLKGKRNLSEYLSVAAVLNSSAICFYMKQICHQKQLTGGDGVRVEFVSKVPYQFSGTALKKLPIPSDFIDGEFKEKIDGLSLLAFELSSQLSLLSPSVILKKSIDEDLDINHSWLDALKRQASIRSKLIHIQEEIDWLTYCAFGLCSSETSKGIDGWVDVEIDAGQRPFELVRQFNQDGFEVPKDIPISWPKEMKEMWLCRMEAIRSIKEIKILEDPHYKRRWIGRQGLFNKSAKADALKNACKDWIVSYLENFCAKDGRGLYSCSILADKLRGDEELTKAAKFYCDGKSFDLQKLVTDLIADDSVPQFASGRLSPKGMLKFRVWQEVWNSQYREDLIDIELGLDGLQKDVSDTEFNKLKAAAEAKKTEEVGDILTPPKYISSDYIGGSYWSLRGKLDVPKERFFSLPGCEKDGDNTLVIGWAGLNHLQRAQAIAAWYEDRKENDGWEAERLMPMLVAIDELIPWLKQWHNDLDSEYGERMGDFYESYLLEELRRWELTREELLDWRPPTTTRRRR